MQFHRACRVVSGFALLFGLAIGGAGAQNGNPSPRAGARYTITPIGPLPEGTRSVATGLSPSSRIAGLSFEETYQGAFYTQWPPFPETTRGFIWEKGTMTPLLPPEGYQGTWANGLRVINDAGQVVGTAAKVDPSLPSPPGWQGHPALTGKVPVVWNREGKPQILPLPDGWSIGSAYAINNRGQIAGWAADELGLEFPPEYWMLGIPKTPLFWDTDLKPTVLPHLPAFANGRCGVTSINDSALIVGNCASLDFSNQHAVLWDNGNVIDLTPTETGYSEADNLNNRGQVVGFSEGQGVLWDKGVQTRLGVLQGDAWSWALAINNRGQIVGLSSDDSDDIGRGFLWEDGQMVDLNTVFDDSDDRWRIGWPYAINDQGEIVGTGFRKDSQGQYRATGYLLTPVAAIDVNGDGQVNLSDLHAVLRAFFGSDLTPSAVAASDFNANGIVDLHDLRWLLQRILASR